MSITRGELVQRIARELDREDDLDAITDALCDTLADVERRGLWPQDSRRARLTTKCGQRWYSLLDDSMDAISQDEGCEPLSEICDPQIAGKIRDIVEVDDIEVMFHQCQCGCCNFPPRMCRLKQVGYEQFRCLTDCRGCPTHFTLYAGQIGLWPVPSCAWKLAISGKFKQPKPERDCDTSPLLCDATELIRRGTRWRFQNDYMNDADGAMRDKLLFEEQLQLLQRERRKREVTGCITRACI